METKTRKAVIEDRTASREQRRWRYLELRPGSGYRTRFLKGSRIRAVNIWDSMTANKETPEDAAREWNLPLEAIQEIVRYCEANIHLILQEAEEERARIDPISLTPPAAR